MKCEPVASRLFFALFLALALGCSENSHLQGSGGGDGSDGDADADASADGSVDGGGNDKDDSDNDGICDEQAFAIEYAPTQLMILLDNSGTMNHVIGGKPPTISKWQIAKEAVAGLIEEWTSSDKVGVIEFGFDVFPDFECAGKGFCCDVFAPVVADCETGNGQDLVDLISNAAAPAIEFDTPLCDGMNIFNNPVYAPNFFSAKGSKYLVVVSDGSEECNAPGATVSCGADPDYTGVVAIVQSLVNNGIKVFVIGFGMDVNASQLNIIAANGGTDYKQFIDAGEEEQLQSVMETIAAEVMSCEWAIDDPSELADPNKVNFYFDNIVVPNDDGCAKDTVGWTWADDKNSVVKFCKDACRDLQTGGVKTVSAKFGCPTVDLE